MLHIGVHFRFVCGFFLLTLLLPERALTDSNNRRLSTTRLSQEPTTNPFLGPVRSLKRGAYALRNANTTPLAPIASSLRAPNSATPNPTPTTLNSSPIILGGYNSATPSNTLQADFLKNADFSFKSKTAITRSPLSGKERYIDDGNEPSAPYPTPTPQTKFRTTPFEIEENPTRVEPSSVPLMDLETLISSVNQSVQNLEALNEDFYSKSLQNKSYSTTEVPVSNRRDLIENEQSAQANEVKVQNLEFVTQEMNMDSTQGELSRFFQAAKGGFGFR